MRPESVLSELKAGKLRPVYFLAGEEKLQRDQVLAAILKAASPDPLNTQEFFGDSADADELLSSAQTQPMFSDRRVLIVKRAEALHAAPKKALVEYLADPLKSTTLVLLLDERPAKGDALQAAAEAAGAALTFYALKPDEAEAWAIRTSKANGMNLTPGAAELLVSEAGTDLAILQQELSKLLQFTKDSKGEVNETHVAATLGFQQAENIFELGSAVQAKDVKEALRLSRRLLETEDAFRLLYQVSTTLEKQLRAKRLLAAGRSEDDVFRATRMNKWYNKDFVKLASKRTEGELIRGLERALETEARLKSSPAASHSLELERLLVDVCGLPTAPLTRR
jgi:DNA polymerase-3 subunit delta